MRFCNLHWTALCIKFDCSTYFLCRMNQSIWKYKLSKIFLDFPVPQYARRASILRAISYFSVQATQMVSANENLWILSSWRSLVAKTILLRAIININQESKCTSVMRCVAPHTYRTSPQCLNDYYFPIACFSHDKSTTKQAKQFILSYLIILFFDNNSKQKINIKMKFSAAVVLASVGYTNAFSGSS